MNENYRCLKNVLDAAFKQASEGKGAERHGQNGSLDFMEQPMMAISSLLDTDGGLAYQAIKKITEARGMAEFPRQERELLGAINYIAGMIMHLRRIDSIKRADADFDNTGAQLESLALSGCATRYQAEEKARYGFALAFASQELMEKFRNEVEKHRVNATQSCPRIPILRLYPDMAERHKHDGAYIASYGKIINMKCNLPEKRSLIAQLNSDFDEYARNVEKVKNPPKSEPATLEINEATFMMVTKLLDEMVTVDGEGPIVNAGKFWETGNRHRDLYARRFVDVVKTQAMLHPGETIRGNMIGHHEGYTLDITDQRAYILELLDGSGMYTVSTYPQASLAHSIRVVYNHNLQKE